MTSVLLPKPERTLNVRPTSSTSLPIYWVRSRTIGTVMTISKPAGITRRGRAERNLSGVYPVYTTEYPTPLPLKSTHSGGRSSPKRNKTNSLQNRLCIHQRTNDAKNDAFSPENCRFGAVYCSFGELFGAQRRSCAHFKTEPATRSYMGTFLNVPPYVFFNGDAVFIAEPAKTGAKQGRLTGGTVR